MGYYTDYEVTCNDPAIEIDDVMSDFTRYEFRGGCVSEVKWYFHEEDMKKLSTKYPGILFTVYGVGEGHPDIWVMYAKDGEAVKMQAEIVYPPCPWT